MITLNGNKFAANEDEFVSSLFESGSTCVGFYKANKKSITLFNKDKVKIGVINAYGVLVSASKVEGKWWYSYELIPEVGDYTGYADSYNEPKRLFIELCGIDNLKHEYY